jgi:MoaA/NifB/PqqE/SkfB family radical SAM enzyme
MPEKTSIKGAKKGIAVQTISDAALKEGLTKETLKTNVIDTMRADIRMIARTPEEVARIERLLDEAEAHSRAKRIKAIRKRKAWKKFLTLWKIRWRYGLHWRKPGYVFRIMRNVFLGKIYSLAGMRKYVLRGLELAVTYRCNFRCNHCLCARLEESATRREMGPEDYKKLVKDAMKLGATTFGLEGGEPFISPVWEDVLRAFQPHHNHIVISTNGYLFDEEKAKKCVELGVDTINFSLDNGIPELHDLFRRRRGSFERVVKGIELCKKYGIKVIINTVVHKDYLYTDGFIELLEFAEREKVLVNTLFAKGVGNFNNRDVMMDEEDIRNYQKIIEPYNYVQRHLNFNYGKQFGCPGTKEMINMTPYGDVLNCANMHIYMGNVLEEPLAVIRERALKETPFGRYNECFLAVDRDFMNVYYGVLRTKGYMTIPEFRLALREYEEKNGKVVYPELHEDQSAKRGGQA